MPEQPRRPVNILPWLGVAAPFTIGGVEFRPPDDLGTSLGVQEAEQVRAMCKCFRTIGGIQGENATLESLPRPTVAFVSGRAPADTRSLSKAEARLTFACHIVGSDVLASRTIRAEAVQPYPFSVSESDPRTAYFLTDDYGNLTMTSISSFVVVKPPWLRPLGQEQPSGPRYRPYVAFALGKLVDAAVAGKPPEWRTLSSLQWFVQSHSHALYSLHLGDGPNIATLSTAFEVLLDVPKGNKTEALRANVSSLTGRNELGDFAAALYESRNDIVHGSQNLTPRVGPARHIRNLVLGQWLFWVCARLVLEEKHGIEWNDQLDPVVPDRIRSAMPPAAAHVAHLVNTLTSNRERLKELGRVFKTRQTW